MGVERRIGHTKKEEGNAFLFFCPEAAEGGMAEQGPRLATARFARFALAWPRLALDKDKD